VKTQDSPSNPHVSFLILQSLSVPVLGCGILSFKWSRRGLIHQRPLPAATATAAAACSSTFIHFSKKNAETETWSKRYTHR
jgi:hypothetical protein